MEPGPVLAQETRNGRVQAIHTGHAVLLGADGVVRRTWGDPTQGTYWRSAAKPFQALPFVASGAFASLGFGDAELAVACGSHAAEPFQVAAARRIMVAAGIPEEALQCGLHDPGPQAGRMPEAGWSAIHNNCSGKHAAMLATCRQRGWPLDSYLGPEHPLQKEILGWVATATDIPAGAIEHGVDGCGLPTFHLPVVELARGFQWLALGGEPAATRILDAMARRSEMVGGTANSDTDLPKATKGRVVSKYGALGVVGAVERRTGEAIAVKLDAGGSQAARAVAVAVMGLAGWLGEDEAAALRGHSRPAVTNHAGLGLGHLETRL